eukprot:TRINITY_DN64405_c0_g1_i1.p1 TRINITY_DN64405_c0_g1~~TRINITY_DN64405_c0_g1_i1.p1  ORF type:complete len:244 (+),score=57.15 TRINITY_DN64405_c0_g1_i1:56-733(+)
MAGPRAGAAVGERWLLALACALACGAPSGVVAVVTDEAKTPSVKWGQKPDSLFLTVVLPEVEDLDVKYERRRLIVKGKSHGVDYKADMKFLRPINKSASSHEVQRWSIKFVLKKEKEEPCWLKLLAGKGAAPGWLKKDVDRAYPEDCLRAKEKWREAYFTAKLDGKELTKKSKKEKKESEEQKADRVQEEKKKETEIFKQKLRDFRKRAVPRASLQKSKAKKTKR